MPIDPVLTEITNDAIHLLNPTYSIHLAANFYFGVVSSLVLIAVCAVVTERVVEPRLGKYRGDVTVESGGGVSPQQSRGLRFALVALVASIVVMALLTFPSGAPLRDQDTGSDRRQLALYEQSGRADHAGIFGDRRSLRQWRWDSLAWSLALTLSPNHSLT